mmetsp:Transcript_19987/g.32966  ORF Transcript_19987/g.32966 Transcript_19987/m.32966 type:complete len:291 (+) Transcript_19987:511-1383(+)|eukprot:CAMPEP_0203764190 /NCGR_PEP_ID=MMETSP0098-20131031/17503_1 /ASSEMBLY_ACC=CAM_ASM_000208 /TAXON_ID=96639 /ORGANISM=" , Strain NY0313808BC1" /LENGTH=290 /DNA_ID=CAMNT_0050659935 /DNA_START=485 /DNA_END=1357 /DNA_ORIENTATION=+
MSRLEGTQIDPADLSCEEDGTDKSHGLLILMRHGQSMWNRQPDNPDRLWRYAGSNDVALSEQGIKEALDAGESIADIPIDMVFSSNLSRATTTAMIALSKHKSGLTPIVATTNGSAKEGLLSIDSLPDDTVLPIICSDQLNERNFGDLQGMPSTEHLVKYSEEYLKKVRNCYTTRFPGKNGESTKDVYERVVPYFEKEILPLLQKKKNIFLCSHGFVLRSIIKHIEKMSDKEFNEEMLLEKTDPEKCRLLAATGVPLLFRFDKVQKSSGIPKILGALDRDYELHQTCAPY